MKRPLFWAIVSCALGESACVTIGYDFIRAGIIGLLLLFSLLFIRRDKRMLLDASILTFFFILGFIYPQLTGLTTKQIRSAVSENGSKAQISGVIHEASETDYGIRLTVKVKLTVLDDMVIEDRYKIIINLGEDAVRDNTMKPGCAISASGKLTPFDSQRVPGGFDKRKYYLARGVLYELKKAKINMPGAGIGDTEGEEEHKEEADGDREISVAPGLISRGYYGLVNALEDLRDSLGRRLSGFASPVTAGILKGILLGDRSDIPDDINKLYRSGGIAHILAISSLHITMISGAIAFLLRLAMVPFLPAWLLTLVLTFLYALMTGFGFATKRAFIMLVISISGKLLGRRYDLLTGLSLAIFIMLIINPYSVYDSSLLMSVAAMFGVALGRHMTNKLDRYVKARRIPVKLKVRNRLIYAFVKTVVFSVGLNLILNPVIAYVYMELPLYSLVINLLVIPLMTLAVAFGFLALLISPISLAVAGIAVKPAGFILMLYDLLTGAFSKLPFAVIRVGGVAVFELAVYYLVVLIVVRLTGKKGLRFLAGLKPVKKRIEKTGSKAFLYKIAAIISSIVILGGALIIFVPRLRTSERIVILDVGQGDGIFISTEDGINIMIDGGSSSQGGIGSYVIEPALKYYRVKKIDYWFVTHTDKDHISGLLEVLEDDADIGIEIGTVVFSAYVVKDEEYDRIVGDCERKGIEVLSMDCFDYIVTDDMRIICIHPDVSFAVTGEGSGEGVATGKGNDKNLAVTGESAGDKNEMSLALLYESSRTRALFTGDMGTEAIEHMINLASEKGIDLSKLDLLKLPHHGSQGSLSENMYSLLKPGGTAVISCGRNNRYGHPHAKVLEVLKEKGVRCRRTDEQGTFIAPDD